MDNEPVTMQQLHSYLKLVDQGKAKPVLCPFDDSPTYLNMEGRFVCLECKAKIDSPAVKNFINNLSN